MATKIKVEVETPLDVPIKGYLAFEKVARLVFNRYGLRVGGTAVRYHDTVGIYATHLIGRAKASRVAEVRAFVQGCKDAMISTGEGEYYGDS